MAQKTAAGYGKGVVEIDDAPHDLLLGPDELLAIIDAPDYKAPVLPAIALELLALARSPDLDLRQVLRLLERDAMLTARVLRIAQSPMYASRVAVSSLGDALNRLGLDGLSRIVLEATVGMSVFRVPGFDAAVDSLRRHSTATAYIARAVARVTKIPTEPAFLCGLLHDVGVVACLLIFARPRAGRERPAFDDVWSVVEPLHEKVSGRLAALWNLPLEVRVVIGSHHVRPGRRLVPMAGAICVADALACELGAGDEAPPDPSITSALRAQIGFPEEALPELMSYAREVIAQIE